MNSDSDDITQNERLYSLAAPPRSLDEAIRRQAVLREKVSSIGAQVQAKEAQIVEWKSRAMVAKKIAETELSFLNHWMREARQEILLLEINADPKKPETLLLASYRALLARVPNLSESELALLNALENSLSELLAAVKASS